MNLFETKPKWMIFLCAQSNLTPLARYFVHRHYVKEVEHNLLATIGC